MKLIPLIVLLASVSAALATDSYDYKKGEFVVVKHGLSPDKQYSISAGDSNFHINLMDAVAKKKIGPLTEIGEDGVLDSAAEAIEASWSPDSKHVAISFRQDRHLLVTFLYRIENKHAYLVNVPSLFDTVAPKFDREAYKMDDTSRGMVSVKWKGASKFELSETSQYYHVAKNPQSKLGKFAKVTKEDSGDGKETAVYFSAVATCELTDHDGVKILQMSPAKFYDER